VSHFVMLAALLIIQPAAQADQAKSAPEFALKDLARRTVKLSDYRGKVVLINFWATWCAPCHAEMPELVKWQKQYEGRGLQIIGITYPPAKIVNVRKAVKRHAINYTVLLGTRRVAALYDVGEVLPVTIILDREGRIRGSILGILEPEEFDEKVKPLLK
jgi:peroxiredoxin